MDNLKGETGEISFHFNYLKKCIEVIFYPKSERGGYYIDIKSGAGQIMKEILPLLTPDEADMLLDVLNTMKSQGELF